MVDYLKRTLWLALLSFSSIAIAQTGLRDPSFLAKLQPAQAAGGAEPSPGPVAWWKFVTDATDSSGNALNGSLDNGAAISGAAMVLDGVDDVMTVADNALLQPASITLSIWVTGTGFNTYTGLISKNHGSGHYQVFIKSSGKLAVYFSCAGGEVSYDGTGVHTLSVGVRHHVAVTYDSAVGLVAYVDGVVDATAGANGGLVAGTGTFAIGDDLVNASREFAGTVDDGRLYDYALSAANVALLTSNGPR